MVIAAESFVVLELKQLLTEAKEEDLFSSSACQICIHY
jgi:hypothetical protein